MTLERARRSGSQFGGHHTWLGSASGLGLASSGLRMRPGLRSSLATRPSLPSGLPAPSSHGSFSVACACTSAGRNPRHGLMIAAALAHVNSEACCPPNSPRHCRAGCPTYALVSAPAFAKASPFAKATGDKSADRLGGPRCGRF